MFLVIKCWTRIYLIFISVFIKFLSHVTQNVYYLRIQEAKGCFTRWDSSQESENNQKIQSIFISIWDPELQVASHEGLRKLPSHKSLQLEAQKQIHE